MTNVAISFFTLLLLLIARSESFRLKFKNSRKLHIRLMWIVVAVDTSLVLYLAAGRNVLEKVNTDMSLVLIIHIILAIAVIIGYFFAAFWGFKLSKGDENYRKKMIYADRFLIPARTLVFLTILYLKLNA